MLRPLDDAPDGYVDVALPVRWDGHRPAPRHAPPRPGEDTEAVLAELGM